MSALADEFTKASEAVAGLASRVDDQVDRANLQQLAEALSNIAAQIPATDAAGKLTNDGVGALTWTP